MPNPPYATCRIPARVAPAPDPPGPRDSRPGQREVPFRRSRPGSPERRGEADTGTHPGAPRRPRPRPQAGSRLHAPAPRPVPAPGSRPHRTDRTDRAAPGAPFPRTRRAMHRTGCRPAHQRLSNGAYEHAVPRERCDRIRTHGHRRCSWSQPVIHRVTSHTHEEWTSRRSGRPPRSSVRDPGKETREGVVRARFHQRR